MYKPLFGKGRQMKFTSPEEYYETLGFIAKSDGTCDIYREENQNQGAWSYEVRMNCYKNLTSFPPPLKRKLTRGKGKKVLRRINCNEFFEDLINNHNFDYGLTQDTESIRSTIPKQYLADFDRGLRV